jgi:hypothetical protein
MDGGGASRLMIQAAAGSADLAVIAIRPRK